VHPIPGLCTPDVLQCHLFCCAECRNPPVTDSGAISWPSCSAFDSYTDSGASCTGSCNNGYLGAVVAVCTNGLFEATGSCSGEQALLHLIRRSDAAIIVIVRPEMQMHLLYIHLALVWLATTTTTGVDSKQTHNIHPSIAGAITCPSPPNTSSSNLHHNQNHNYKL
jgi:hypothetical protein